MPSPNQAIPQSPNREVWLTGPVDGVHPLMLPAVHALLQAREDVSRLIADLSVEQIWQRPAGSAAIGFHALHIAGATERLLTYARGEALTDAQLAAAREEKALSGLPAAELIARVDAGISAAVEQIRSTDLSTLIDRREVGRQKLPSTVFGLIFHAAEHASRHAGQIATLKKIVTPRDQGPGTRESLIPDP
jgi:uncharacterized damage-inducible protein DinB